MKQIVTSIVCLLLSTIVHAQNTFVRGADISWCTEMEASGRTFQTVNGQEMELCALLKEIGMNTVQFVVINAGDEVKSVKDGALCNVAPTILKLMGIPQPAAMTAEPLI